MGFMKKNCQKTCDECDEDTTEVKKCKEDKDCENNDKKTKCKDKKCSKPTTTIEEKECKEDDDCKDNDEKTECKDKKCSKPTTTTEEKEETISFVGSLKFSRTFTTQLEDTESQAFLSFARRIRLQIMPSFCEGQKGCSLTILQMRRGSVITDFKVTAEGKESDLESTMNDVLNSLPKVIAATKVEDRFIKVAKECTEVSNCPKEGKNYKCISSVCVCEAGF